MSKLNNITAIVLTQDEEANINNCLQNLTWTDRTVLVDSGSTDNTATIAKALGCDIYFNPWPGFACQRNWALKNTDIKTEWVIFIDADEEVTNPMYKEIIRSIQSSDFNAYYICFKVIFLNKWVKYSSNFPIWHPRIVRNGFVNFKTAISGHGETWEVNGKIGYIQEPYIHYSFSKGLSSWFEKHNHLSMIESNAKFKIEQSFYESIKNIFTSDAHVRRQSLRALSYNIPLWPFLRFIYQFIFKRGFLDGMPGWIYCTLYLIYELMIFAKIEELSNNNKDK